MRNKLILLLHVVRLILENFSKPNLNQNLSLDELNEPEIFTLIGIFLHNTEGE